MVNLDIEQAHRVRGQGYGIEMRGLDTHRLPLYLHKASLSDKKRGDVFMKYKIANPKTGPNQAELQYLASKGASMGVFAWSPGEDCLVKKFTNVEYVKVGRETRVVRHEPYKGCMWCREDQALTTKVHPVEEEVLSEAEPAVDSASPQPDANCSECGFSPKQRNKKGKPFSVKQREAQLRAHARGVHKSTDTSGASPEVPTVESVGVGEVTN